MASKLDEIRKKLAELDSKRTGNNSNNDKVLFPHWNMPDGSSSTIRFLEDGSPENTFFWVEKKIIKLKFPGICGQDSTGKEVEVQVPCVEMYNDGSQCPILTEIRPMWKDKALEDTARKYWKKSTYLFQGFVKQNSVPDDVAPENPIRKFIIGPQLFPLIKAALMDPELDSLPTDYVKGLDFIIAKTSKGGYADYNTSKWGRKESALTAEQIAAVDQFGLYKLDSFLPKKPNAEQMTAIFEMFEASISGEYYDPEKWSKFYKPYGFESAPTNTSNVTDADVAAAEEQFENARPVVSSAKVSDHTNEDSVVETKVTGGTKSPKEILELLRNRKS